MFYVIDNEFVIKDYIYPRNLIWDILYFMFFFIFHWDNNIGLIICCNILQLCILSTTFIIHFMYYCIECIDAMEGRVWESGNAN